MRCACRRTTLEKGSPGVCICADSEAGGLLPIQALPSDTQVPPVCWLKRPSPASVVIQESADASCWLWAHELPHFVAKMWPLLLDMNSPLCQAAFMSSSPEVRTMHPHVKAILLRGPCPCKEGHEDWSNCAAPCNSKPRRPPFGGRPAPRKMQPNDLSICAGATCAKQLHFGVWVSRGR